MSEPRTINLPGSGTDTQSYELAPGLLQYVQAVYVTVDNSAGGDARPTLTLSEQSGVVIAKKRQGEAIAAGDTGSATWALRLTDEQNETGEIRYDTVNVGDWLYVETTGHGGPDSKGIEFQDSAGRGISLLSDGGTILIQKPTGPGHTAPDFDANLDGMLLQGTGDMAVQSDANLTLTGSGDTSVGAGGALSLSGATMGFFAKSPVAQPAHPVTLGDVIAALTALGLTA